MQASEFDKGLIVAAAWCLARSADVNELLAIACVIRNWVIRRPDKIVLGRSVPNTTTVYPSYGKAINYFLDVYPVRDLPTGREPGLIDPAEGLLAKIDGVYDNTLPDITSSRHFPGGARFFGVAAVPGYELIGTFGGQQFFGTREA